jgi:hypothetical protein
MKNEIKTSDFNRFDFEQKIMQCWTVCEDIQSIFEASMNRDLDKNSVQNALLGMMTLYQIRFENLFEMFEKGIQDRKIL